MMLIPMCYVCLKVEKLEHDVQEIDDRYTNVNDAISAQTKLLQATITQSQDVQGAITELQSWLDKTQTALATQQLIALEQPLVAEQQQQFKYIAADVDGYVHFGLYNFIWISL